MTAANHGSAAQQQPLTEEEAFQLGVDAYIYGYPLVVMDSVRRVSTNVVEPQGMSAPSQFANSRSFPDASKRVIAGANVDTLYSFAWRDLSRDPYVLHLPDANNRFYLMPVLDGWTEVIGNAGTRTTGDNAGDYAITGPQWTGILPAGSNKPNPTRIWFGSQAEPTPLEHLRITMLCMRCRINTRSSRLRFSGSQSRRPRKEWSTPIST
jgi:hypothetical protein